jgi:HPt (histidine-containing phosphotransfer) domain-containing protein
MIGPISCWFRRTGEASMTVSPHRILIVDDRAGPATVLRFERLDEIAHGVVACERDLLEILLADAAQSLDKIGVALGASDVAVLTAMAHGLYGACRTVGADALAGLCHDLEQAVKTSGLPDTRTTMKAFRRAFDDLRTAAAAHLQGREAVSR